MEGVAFLRRTAFFLILLAVLPSLVQAQLAGFRTKYSYVGNRQSKLVHLAYYHHLPDDYLRENFEDLEEALEHGYSRCPICFPDHPMVPGYDFERQLGIAAAALVNYYYPSPAPDEVMKRVEEAGGRVLANWPFPLKGYPYEFTAVESDMFKAFSCPTGFVYLTTGLIGILESEEELEIVLAHEISHIENRHAFAQFQSRFSSPQVSQDAVALSRQIDELARSLVLVGYDEAAEEESDLYAHTYGISRYKEDRGTLVLLLNKLRDISWQEARTSGGLFSIKSDLEQRIAEIQSTRIHLFPRNQSYRQRDGDGAVKARARLIMQTLEEGALSLYASIQTKETIPLGGAGTGMLRIRTPETEHVLSQEEVTFLRKQPEDEAGFHTYLFTFTSGGEAADGLFGLDLGSVTGISFDKQQGLRNTRTVLSFTR